MGWPEARLATAISGLLGLTLTLITWMPSCRNDSCRRSHLTLRTASSEQNPPEYPRHQRPVAAVRPIQPSAHVGLRLVSSPLLEQKSSSYRDFTTGMSGEESWGLHREEGGSTGTPVSTFHRITRPSALPDTRKRPSRDHAMQVIIFLQQAGQLTGFRADAPRVAGRDLGFR